MTEAASRTDAAAHALLAAAGNVLDMSEQLGTDFDRFLQQVRGA